MPKVDSTKFAITSAKHFNWMHYVDTMASRIQAFLRFLVSMCFTGLPFIQLSTGITNWSNLISIVAKH